MGALNKIFCVFGLVLAFAIYSGFPAVAQDNHIAKKTDGRFTANLRSYIDQGDETHGMIDYIEMDIQWWGLMGQPVCIYGFKFVPTGQYELPDGRRLSRDQLSKYPDLQARFDDLRPSQVEVAFDIKVSPRNTGGTLTGSTDRLVTPNYYVGGGGLTAIAAKGTVTTSSFLTGRPNKMMQDMSPGSPREWKDFVVWEYASPDNTRAQNTFREAQRIEFTSLRITKITLPDATAGFILDEFKLREEKDKKADTPPIDPWADAMKNDTSSARTATRDDPWADALADDTQASRSTAKNDPWASTAASQSSASTNDPWASTNADLVVPESSEPDFKIEQRSVSYRHKMGFMTSGNLTGVVDSEGNVLIPFRRWNIETYEDGLAKVSYNGITMNEGREQCAPGFAVRYIAFPSGKVDSYGAWVGAIEIDVKGVVSRKGTNRSGSTVWSSWCTVSEDGDGCSSKVFANGRRITSTQKSGSQACAGIIKRKLSGFKSEATRIAKSSNFVRENSTFE